MKHSYIFQEKDTLTPERLQQIQAHKIRTEKIAVKDVKLRTFIADDNSRDDLVAHVYDVTYGIVKPTDNLVIIDDSIVRGTTLKKSILTMLDRLAPKQIVVVSSAPQIRYPDCYGIDMARLEDLIAQDSYPKEEIQNFVKRIYESFTEQEISDKIADLIGNGSINSQLKLIFQTVEDLHKACPKNLGDWYFTGNYPTVGGNRVANQAFINFYEGNMARAY